MRIVILIPSLAMGGAEGLAVLQANELYKAGQMVWLVSVTDQMLLAKNLLIPQTNCISLHYQHAVINAQTVLQTGKLKKAFNLLMHTIKPDFIIAHLPLCHWLARWSVWRLRAAKYPDKNTIPRLICYHHSVQFRANPINSIGKYLFNKVNRFLAQKADWANIFVSKASLLDHEKKWHKLVNPYVLPSCIVRHNAGSQVAKALLQQNGIPQTAFLILLPGRLHPAKGHLLFLDALEQLQKLPLETAALAKWFFPDIAVLFVGNGPMRSQIQQTINDKNLADTVFLLGQQPNEIVQALMSLCALVVTPSLFEGFGLVAAEALMQGCPVLGSEVGVFPEIIASNTNGLLFETGNSTRLALQLQNIRQQINEGIYNREQIQCKADLLFSVKQYMTGLMQILSPS